MGKSSSKPFQSIDAKAVTRGETGVVYDEAMLLHENPWDSDHIECPDRLGVSHRRCQELGLLDRCERLPSRRASDEELLLAHSKEYIEKLVRVLMKLFA